MVSYNIQLDEKLIEPLLLEFGDNSNIESWIQEQVRYVILERTKQAETEKPKRRKVAVSKFVKSIGRDLGLSAEPDEKKQYREYLESKHS